MCKKKDRNINIINVNINIIIDVIINIIIYVE